MSREPASGTLPVEHAHQQAASFEGAEVAILDQVATPHVRDQSSRALWGSDRW
jgi:hypothetical protein